jgi:hypothetical protein
MLGYRFSPRLRDLSDQRFWRAEMPEEKTEDYEPLNAIARNKINLDKVVTWWPDMLRVAGSLITNQVRAYDLLRMFGREGRMSTLGQAFAEYGRIDKTMHRLAWAICHGKRGQIVQAYREGQEDQLAALGLVLNAVVLWTTQYLDAAVAELKAAGHVIDEADKARDLRGEAAGEAEIAVGDAGDRGQCFGGGEVVGVVEVQVGPVFYQDERLFLGRECPVLVDEPDAAVELRIPGEPFLDAGHSDEDQAELAAVVVVAQLLQGGHLEPVGFVDDEQLGERAAAVGLL